MRSLLIWLLGICHALAKPTLQDEAVISTDDLPVDFSDNAVLPPINSPNNEVATCLSETPDNLSNRNLENSHDEEIMSRDFQECPNPNRGDHQSPGESQRNIPFIAIPSKPNNQCPSTHPMFVSCGGPEVVAPDRFGSFVRFFARSVEYPFVVNCVEGESLFLSNGNSI